ncbi:MAG: hypothetical protein ACTJGE_08260, partial [Corynebacterium variabile]
MTTHTGLLAVLTAGVLTLGLTACGGDDEPARPTTTEAAENRGFTGSSGWRVRSRCEADVMR